MFTIGLIASVLAVSYVGGRLAGYLAETETRYQCDTTCEWQSWHPIVDEEYNPMNDVDGTYLAEREM